MSVFVETPYPVLSFGDLCSGFPWYDASLRLDATALRIETTPAALARKRWGVDREIDFFVRADGVDIKPTKDTDYVLAHGREFQEAVCVSDDCVIETALGRGNHEPSGQLLFAPVTEFRQVEAAALERNLRRHRLGEDRVVELHRTFRVRSGDIVEAEGLTRVSLTDGARTSLAAHWAAHVCRTGPLVAADNADKLAQLLIQKEGWPEDSAIEFVQRLANVSALAWQFESKGLEGAGQEYDDHRENLQAADASTALVTLKESLQHLRDTADGALSALA